jgi:hypothetical protein
MLMFGTAGVRARGWLAAAIFLCFAPVLRFAEPTAAAQSQQKQPKADICPWCKNDPKILAKAKLVGHGPMPFGKTTSEDVKNFLSYTTLYFIESEHFRIASSLEGYSIPEEEWRRYEAELLELKKVLPGVTERMRTLDPWLRMHLYAMRCEQRYQRFLSLLKITDADFYEKRDFGKPYMGEGKFLGMKDKYEISFLKDLRQFKDLLRDQAGSTQQDTKRWHYVERGVLAVFIPVWDSRRDDVNLYAHLSHNLGHEFVLGYKHYTYEPPKWFEEGFAHMYEKEISEEYNSFDSEEAAIGQMYEGKDWRQGVLRILGKGKAAPTADMIHKKGLSDIGKDDHLITWSRVEFMVKTMPDKFPKFMNAIRGRIGPNGQPDGANIQGVQRDFFKEECGWTLAEFDREWEKWVNKTYLTK